MNIKACLLFIAVLCLARPWASGADFTKADEADKRFHAAVVAFWEQHHRYPRTLKELKSFASTTQPLDLTPFYRVQFFKSTDPGSLSVTLYSKQKDYAHLWKGKPVLDEPSPNHALQPTAGAGGVPLELRACSRPGGG